ncbi:MAG: hypothetical protein EA362_03090 [Saprospirales bacterium]|nr:MAG: hypothetical protein EA362_03090 [Saprospirales bacterium]
MNFKRIVLFTLLLIFVLSSDLLAQCPMCRMTVESNFADGGTAGLGLNRGILYLLAAPYFVVGGIAFMWWKNRKAEQAEMA